MNTIPSVFSFKSSEVRTVVVNDEPWFIASDVCTVLGMKNHREAIRHLDEDERGVISNDTPSSNQHGSFGTVKQEVSIINESGLYALVLRSRKPEAKPFIKWVTKEVLPAIRKTGRYEAAPYSVNPNDTLTKEQQDTLRNLLTESAKQRYPDDSKQQGAFIMRGWSKLKAHFKVGYRDIPAAEFTEAVSIAARHALEGDYLPAESEIENAAMAMLQDMALGKTLLDGMPARRLYAEAEALGEMAGSAHSIAVQLQQFCAFSDAIEKIAADMKIAKMFAGDIIGSLTHYRDKAHDRIQHLESKSSAIQHRLAA